MSILRSVLIAAVASGLTSAGVSAAGVSLGPTALTATLAENPSPSKGAPTYVKLRW